MPVAMREAFPLIHPMGKEETFPAFHQRRAGFCPQPVRISGRNQRVFLLSREKGGMREKTGSQFLPPPVCFTGRHPAFISHKKKTRLE
jgi:hypothetical protein